MGRIAKGLSAALTLGIVAASGAANASTWSVSVYGGWNGSFNSDAHFTGPNTDWTVRDVPWDGVSFGSSGGAPYYGARLTYWPSAWQNLGIALDYTHAKIRAVRDATVSYDGTLDGTPRNGSESISDLFDVLEYTDGLNLVTVNALYKLRPFGVLHPYVGLGAGISIPHVEVTGNDTPFPRTFQYEFGGPAAQALIGVDAPITKRLSLFGEYKITWADVNAPVNGGYHIHTVVVTNHLLAGLTLHFGRT